MVGNEASVQTFGKYQILDRVATGDTAEILRARLEGIGGFQRTFAIKRVLPHLAQDPDLVRALVDEAKVAGLLSHANIVQIFDLGEVEGSWYVAMEYVDGPNLAEVLRRARARGLSVPVPHALYVGIEILKGLEYAHGRTIVKGGRSVPLHIIHRDVCPSNVLLSLRGEVKLTDFGVARAHLRVEGDAPTDERRWAYRSPEQVDDVPDLDARSDVFSVGVVLYEMLTGQHPFVTAEGAIDPDRIRRGEYTPASQVNAAIPPALEGILHQMLRVDRTKRYPSATATKEALDSFFHDAGFLFTHATLAGYLRQLFPDAARPARERGHDYGTDTPDSLPPGAVVTDDDEDADHQASTRRLPRPEALSGDSATPLAAPPTSGTPRPPSAPGIRSIDTFDPDDESEPTKVRRTPLAPTPRQLEVPERSEPSSAPPLELDLDGVAESALAEQETQIRGNPFVVDPAALGNAGMLLSTASGQGLPGAPGAFGSEGPPPVRPPPLIEDTDASMPGVSIPGVDRDAGPTRPNPWLLAGVGLGSAAAAMVLGLAMGIAWNRASAPVPELVVQAPPGATVTVGGVPISGRAQLAPGRAHEVVVDLHGQSSAFPVTLDPGEIRFLLVTEQQLRRDDP